MHRASLIVAALAVSALSSAASAVTFFDGVFTPADWSLTTITNAAGAGSTAQGVQIPTGGNTNQFRRVSHQLLVGAPNGFLFSFHLNANAFYTPSAQGAITSIDYSEDSINFTPDTIVPGNGQGSGLLILQNGNFYRQQNPLLVMPYSGFSNWAPNAAPGLVAADFAQVTLAGAVLLGNNPDFSITGTTMQFGFHRGNSGNGSYNTECGIDNWSVTIVPAPASLLAVAGLATLRRRRHTISNPAR